MKAEMKNYAKPLGVVLGGLIGSQYGLFLGSVETEASVSQPQFIVIILLGLLGPVGVALVNTMTAKNGKETLTDTINSHFSMYFFLFAFCVAIAAACMATIGNRSIENMETILSVFFIALFLGFIPGYFLDRRYGKASEKIPNKSLKDVDALKRAP